MRREGMDREKSWQALWEEENFFLPRRNPSGREREGNDRFLPSREFHELFFGQQRRKFCAMVL